MKHAPRSIGAILFVLGCLLWAENAVAGSGSRLVYGRAAGAAACPDESELRAAVRARLGYDPFFPWADQTVVVQVAPRPNRRLSGKVYVVDAQGRASPEREFTTAVDECHELVQTLSLAIVIAVDPLHGTVSAAPAPAEKRPTPEPDESSGQAPALTARGSESGAAGPAVQLSKTSDASREAVAVDSASGDGISADRGGTASPSTPIGVDLGLGPLLSAGSMPGISSGFMPFVRVRRGFASLALEGRYEVPVWGGADTDRAAVSSLGGALTPCLHWKILGTCATLLLARYRAEGLDVAPLTATALFAAAGLRAGAEMPITPGVWGFLRAEGLVHLTRHELWIGGGRVWQMPPLGVMFSAGAAVSIL